MAANGRRYQAAGTITAAATKTIVAITGGTTVRPAVYDLVLSNFATPADNSAQWQVRRSTAAGTSTAVTPSPLDSGDPASTTVAGQTHTVEPTYTASVFLLDVAVNQRATFRWVAAPNSEFVVPATASNGIGIQCVAVNAFGKRHAA